jgi:hypothetical protein
MVTRDEPVFLLHPRVIGAAGAISLALCLLLPLVALVCWLVGGIAWVALWVVIGALFAIFYVLFIGGVLLAIGGVFALFGGSTDDERGTGCGLVIVGVIGNVIGRYATRWWGEAYTGLSAAAAGAYDFCARNAGAIVNDVWLGYNIVWLVWLVLAVALLAAVATLVIIVLLRAKDRSRGPLAGVHYTCPNGHRAGVAFACPSCGEWEEFLAPSVYGVLHAQCRCGQLLPTSDLIGRNGLHVRCRGCSHPINHPAVGQRTEYHVAVWEPFATAETEPWVQTAARQLDAGGADVEPVVPARDPLPATMIAGDQCGAGLVYAHVLSPEAELPATPAEYHRWTTGLVLLLVLPTDAAGAAGPDHHVAAILNFWDRLRTGRSRRRHAVTIAVVVRWEGAVPMGGMPTTEPGGDSETVRTAVERTGFVNVVRALEARFRRVAFFAQNAPPGVPSKSVPVSSPGSVLGWMCRQVGG